MKSSKKRQVTAAFFAAAALGGVAHAAPVLNMNDLVGSKTTAESTTETTSNVATPVVRPMDTQPTAPTTQPTVITPQPAVAQNVQIQQGGTVQSTPKVTPMVPRVRPVPVPDTAKALEEQYRAVSQPQYVVNKQTNTMMEPTLAMHSLINVQRKTEPVTIQKQVDGKQQTQTTQVQRTPIIVQEQSTTPLAVANTTTTKSVIAKRTLTIRDIQRAERERLAKLAEEQAAQQEAMQQQSSEQAQAVRQMAAERAAEAQRQAALLAQQQEAQRQAELLAQRQAAIKAEQDRIAAQQAEAQRQAVIKAEQDRIAAEQAEAQRQAAIKAEQERIEAEQAEAQRQAAIKAEQERIAAEQAEADAERARLDAAAAKAAADAAAKAKAEAEAKARSEAAAEAQRQAAIKAEQERIAAEQAEAAQEAKIKAEQEAKAKAEAEAKAQAEAKARAEAEAKQAQEPKLPESYVNERNQASTKGSTTTGEKNILSQPIDPPLQADTSAKITLTFDINNYESMTGTVDNKEIKYRAFEYIPYVSNPIDIDQQYINIYIPEEYFNDGTVNGYNTQTAPIFMPNNVGGYMPSQPMTPKVENNKPNSALYALSRGYVVASPATRGRTNKASDGNFIGKAPAVIVDLQAATAYLHANDATMPGNAKRIITNGTSAGGAVSLLQGATGNTSDYQPYLQALGAATASTDVYASSAYAPITNLDAADMAYEWSYNGITSFNKVTMGQGELPQANVGGAQAPMQRSVQRVNLTNDDVAYSDLLKSHFPDYINNLQLRDRTGVILKLDKKGNGTFKQYVKSFIIDAANKAKSNGADLSRYSFLILDKNTGLVKDIDWDAYNSFTSRSKVPGAFDSRSNDSGENSLFGTSTSDTNHFTITAALHDTTTNNDVYVENAKIVTMMNPMNYLGSPSATNAKYYRIRYGTADSNTSVAIPLIVGTRAQNLGYSVDMATPFGVDHAGDYDLQDLFNWMDSIVKNGR
ncbi:MAG: subtype B tannase [Veillonella atypica]